MPRKPLVRSDFLPYHVTARANNREEFPLPLRQVWKILSNECLNLTWVYGVEIHALVLMPNHFHLLLTVPQHDLGRVMNVFISSVTRMSNVTSGRSGHFFGAPYHWSLIKSSRYFGHALKYVYRNPVRAKICERVEDYQFSTLHGLLGLSHLPFPISSTRTGMEISLPSQECQEQLAWLNKPFSIEAESLIQKGLRKKLFDAVVDRKTRIVYDPLNLLS